MKLIRLVSNDNAGFFNNDFHEDLVVKPNSKLALQSVSFETKVSAIEIDSSNDEITVQYTAGRSFNIKLNHTTYTAGNHEILFQDIQNKINEKIGYDASTFPVNRSFGMEWNCQENTKGRVEIRYKIGDNGEYAIDWRFEQSEVQYIIATGEWYQLSTQQGGNNGVILDTFMPRGCGYLRAQTYKYDNNLSLAQENNGYIIGLSTTNLTSKDPSTILDPEITYAIAVSCDSSNVRKYYTVRDGVYTESAVLPNFNGSGDANNDYQEVTINFDKIEFNVYQNGSSTKTQLSTPVDYTAGQKLYPFLIFRANNASLSALRITPSPFGPQLSQSSDTTLFAPPGQDKTTVDENFLEFEGSSLAKFLGYQELRLPQSGFYEAIEFNYVADRTFIPTDKTDAFIVELLNLRCESYDGLLNQRKNILSVIPKSDSNGEVIYEMANPVFIDLNNAKDILLRNIRLRIVRPDYSGIEMLGQGTVVLLLDSN